MHYVAKFGKPILSAIGNSRLGAGALTLADKAIELVRKGCGRFEAGTLVWTTRGPVPIERVQVGDVVLAKDEVTDTFSLRQVLRTFVRRGAPIVAVTVTTAAGAQEVFNTTEEHPFYVEGRGWVTAQSLVAGELVGTTGQEAFVESVVFTGRTSTVYNFEVEGLHDYFVGHGGVLVHNNNTTCRLIFSSIKRDKLLQRAAEEAGRSVQASLDHLVQQLAKGNMNPGIGTKGVFANVLEARARDGARVYFREGANGTIEILAKSNKANQEKVIRRLQELYGR